MLRKKTICNVTMLTDSQIKDDTKKVKYRLHRCKHSASLLLQNSAVTEVFHPLKNILAIRSLWSFIEDASDLHASSGLGYSETDIWLLNAGA